MKRALTLLLICALALTVAPLSRAEEQALYTARARVNTRMYALADGASETVGRIAQGTRFDVLAFDPVWARVRLGDVTGYIRRSTMDTVVAIDPVSTPPYGVEVNRYVGAARTETRVQAAPSEDAQTLITLQAGARLSFICVENGWAKLVFKRQYGYVDTNALTDLRMVYGTAAAGDSEAPIAAYTSFYDVADTRVNQNRIHNIQNACQRMSVTLAPGDTLDFNRDVGPYGPNTGYLEAVVLVDGASKLGYGGGTCQTSSTLYNVLLQLPLMNVLQRRPHGPSGAKYLPHGMDAAVGTDNLNLRFRNEYAFPVRIEASAQDGALYIAIYKAN